jgi:Ca2+-binding RTX toxin-like protein
MLMRRILLAATWAAFALVAVPAQANTSHDGWPRIDGMLLMNKTDSSRPLDARPGRDPFHGTDARYSCDAVHMRGTCHALMVACDQGNAATGNCALGGRMTAPRSVHNELLGGHGDDSIYAGPVGDVLWGDYKPSGQSTAQHDVLIGGVGNDHFYASHGYNRIEGNGGDDWVKAHFGHGIIDCGAGRDVLYISRRAQRGYEIRNCDTVSHTTLGY